MAADDLSSDREFALAAVEKDWRALDFASYSSRPDWEIVMVVMEKRRMLRL